MNIIPFKNRQFNPLMPVEVYRNLHGDDNHKYSIRQEGRVIGHSCDLTLIEAKFRVSEAGRARVISQGRKNVHAKIVGYVAYAEPDPISICDQFEVTYNPYKAAYFFGKYNARSVEYAPYVFIRASGVSVASLAISP